MRTLTMKTSKAAMPTKTAQSLTSALVDIGYFRTRRISSVLSSSSSDSDSETTTFSKFDLDDVKSCSDEDLVRKCVLCFGKKRFFP